MYNREISEKVKKQAKKDVQVYYDWLMDKTKDDECYRYDVLSNVNDWAEYDCMQIKFDCDGDYRQQALELKGRPFESTRYPDCGINIEKVQSLQRFSNCTNIPVYLVALYYSDRKICIWQIDPDKEYQFENRMCEQTQSDWSKGKVEKKIVPFMISEAKKYAIPQHISLGD